MAKKFPLAIFFITHDGVLTRDGKTSYACYQLILIETRNGFFFRTFLASRSMAR